MGSVCPLIVLIYAPRAVHTILKDHPKKHELVYLYKDIKIIPMSELHNAEQADLGLDTLIGTLKMEKQNKAFLKQCNE